MSIEHTIIKDNLISVNKKEPKDFIYDFGFFQLPTKDIPTNLPSTRAACKLCTNYNRNGGCPPRTPEFSRLVELYSNAIIVYIKFEVLGAPIKTILGTNKKTGVERRQPKWFYVVKWWDFVFTAAMKRMVRPVKDNLQQKSFLLWAGNCRGCKTCIFRTDPDGKCQNPNFREYSLESVGIRVDLLMSLVDIPVDWFYSGVKEWPQFLVKVVGILTKEPVDPLWLEGQFISKLLEQHGRYED
jgi:predicted metal-binding protein